MVLCTSISKRSSTEAGSEIVAQHNAVTLTLTTHVWIETKLGNFHWCLVEGVYGASWKVRHAMAGNIMYILNMKTKRMQMYRARLWQYVLLVRPCTLTSSRN
jgi:hypothetical protein